MQTTNIVTLDTIPTGNPITSEASQQAVSLHEDERLSSLEGNSAEEFGTNNSVILSSLAQSSVVIPLLAVGDPEQSGWCVLAKEPQMVTLELCYMTPRGAGVVRYLHDAQSVEKALKGLHKRHIEADLYVQGDRSSQGNRRERVGGVEKAEGETTNGRTVQWQWWYEGGLFAGKQEVRS